MRFFPRVKDILSAKFWDNYSEDLEKYLDETIVEESSRYDQRNRLERTYGKEKLQSAIKQRIEQKQGDLNALFRELIELGGEESFEITVEFLHSEDKQIQTESAKALGQFKEFETREDIIELLENSRELRISMIRNSANASENFKEFIWRLPAKCDDKVTQINCYIRMLNFIGNNHDEEAYIELIRLIKCDVDRELLEEAIKVLEKEARFNNRIKVQKLDEKLINLIDGCEKISDVASNSLALLGSERAIDYFESKNEDLYLKAKGQKTGEFKFEVSEMSLLETGMGWEGVSGFINANLGEQTISNGESLYELTDTAKAWTELVKEAENTGRSSSYGLCCNCGDRGCAGLMVELRSFSDTYSVRLGSHKSSFYIAEIEKHDLIPKLIDFIEDLLEFLEEQGNETDISVQELENYIDELEKVQTKNSK